MITGQKVVKVFNHEEKNIEDFRSLNDALFESADKANYLVNVVGPVNQQLGNVSYVVCAILGGALALFGATGLTLGKLASFLTFNRSFNMPINQVSQQFNAIVMAMAGAERIFEVMDTAAELDEGSVTLIPAEKDANGTLSPFTGQGRPRTWAWKTPPEQRHGAGPCLCGRGRGPYRDHRPGGRPRSGYAGLSQLGLEVPRS